LLGVVLEGRGVLVGVVVVFGGVVCCVLLFYVIKFNNHYKLYGCLSIMGYLIILNMDIKAIFGANLKHYRKLRQLSQEELAEKLDITPKHLSTLETGATFVSAKLLEKITKILIVSASALFYTTEEKSSDDSFLTIIDQIIEKELIKTVETIKLEIRHTEHT
jgi:transcriptional regulator with XRE-family HTH domain